jgi:hypothetical protein
MYGSESDNVVLGILVLGNYLYTDWLRRLSLLSAIITSGNESPQSFGENLILMTSEDTGQLLFLLGLLLSNLIPGILSIFSPGMKLGWY